MGDMSSNRPYLIRALYDWLVDNNQTPYLLVTATNDGVVVPRQFVQDGHIVLNVSPNAVRNLNMDNDLIFFSARFGGRLIEIRVPPSAVLGIYSHENGLGMMFPQDGAEVEADANGEETEEKPKFAPPARKKGKPSLTVVK